MTYYRLKTNPTNTSFILQKSTHCYIQPQTKDTSHTKKPRSQSKLNTDDYDRSLRRAFSRAKQLAFFNPDLTQFITFTYKGTDHTPTQVIQHIKDLVKKHNKHTQHYLENEARLSLRDVGTRQSPETPREVTGASVEDRNAKSTIQGEQVSPRDEQAERPKPLKYIYVMEYQKRGSIHVHMIANDALRLEINKNGHFSVADWSHGFSSVLTIDNFDDNFRPYLYLFKYMSKAERIGSSFVHISKNFDKIENVDYADYEAALIKDNALYTEDHEFIINETTHKLTKEYYRIA